MLEYVAVGRNRLCLMEVVPQSLASAHRVKEALQAVRPDVVLVPLSADAWKTTKAGRRRLKGLDSVLAKTLAPLGPVQPHAVWREVRAWSEHDGTVVHRVDPGAPPSRRAVRRLARLLRKEGFDAQGHGRAMQRLFGHYVHRVPEMAAWWDARRTNLAQGLAATAFPGKRVLALLPAPDADAVCTRAQNLARRSPAVK